MAKEIARFELTNRSNYLLRWTIDDDANLIFNNSDDSKYIEISGRKYYNSALFNFPSSITGHFISVGLLLSDKPTRIYAQESSDGGATWTNSYQTNPMTLSYGTIYSLPGPTSNWNGIYVYNNNENDSQCISSIAPLFDVTSDYNEYVSTVYTPPKKSGGAGSGYIGNSLLSNKKMVGFNVPTSSAEGTKTESVNEASENPVSGKPKIGNGFARIKFIRDLIETNLSSLAKNTDFVNHRKVSGQATDNISFQYTFADLTAYYLSDWILSGSPNTNTYQNGEFNIPLVSDHGSGFLSNGVAIPIDGNTKIYGVKFDCKVVYTIDGSFPRQGFLELIKIGSGNTVTRIDLLRICRDPSTSYDPNNPSHRLAEDDLYHTYEFIFDSPVTFDYVHINGSDVDVYIKNIKLLT